MSYSLLFFFGALLVELLVEPRLDYDQANKHLYLWYSHPTRWFTRSYIKLF